MSTGNPSRTAETFRQTKETKINLSLNLDGAGKSAAETAIGFFDHMLDLLSRHSLIDLTVQAEGDLDVDAHHTVEDVGICLGKALLEAIGGAQGIRRYGHGVVPMDEALAEAAVDVSGRPFLVFKAPLRQGKLGDLTSS